MTDSLIEDVFAYVKPNLPTQFMTVHYLATRFETDVPTILLVLRNLESQGRVKLIRKDGVEFVGQVLE